MACSKQGAMKEMRCSFDGPNRVQKDEKRGVLSKNPAQGLDAAHSADRQLGRETTMQPMGELMGKKRCYERLDGDR